MKRLLILLLILIVAMTSSGIAGGKAVVETEPVGLFVRGGAFVGTESRTEVRGNFGIGLLYKASEKTTAIINVAYWSTNIQSDEKLGTEENISAMAIIKHPLKGRWNVEVGAGVNWLDYSADGMTTNVNSAGYLGVSGLWNWEDMKYGIYCGALYNTVARITTIMFGGTAEFDLKI